MSAPRYQLQDAAYWDISYEDADKPLFGERPNEFLRQYEVILHRHSRLLVLSDGQGRNGVWLANQGHHVVTVDWSEVAVASAKQLAAAKGAVLEQYCADVRDFVNSEHAGGVWDGVIGIFAHLNESMWKAVAAAIVPRLTRFGTVLIEDFTPAQLTMNSGGPTQAEFTQTRESIQRVWHQIHLDTKITERRVFEGRAHRGQSSVIQAIGHRGYP